MEVENEELVVRQGSAALPSRQNTPEKVFGFGNAHANPVDRSVVSVAADLVSTDADNTFDQRHLHRKIMTSFDQLAHVFRRIHQHKITQFERPIINPIEADP